jgi:hypothetical protein
VLAGCASALTIVTLPSEYWGEVIVAVAEAPSDGWEEEARAAVECLTLSQSFSPGWQQLDCFAVRRLAHVQAAVAGEVCPGGEAPVVGGQPPDD